MLPDFVGGDAEHPRGDRSALVDVPRKRGHYGHRHLLGHVVGRVRVEHTSEHISEHSWTKFTDQRLDRRAVAGLGPVDEHGEGIVLAHVGDGHKRPSCYTSRVTGADVRLPITTSCPTKPRFTCNAPCRGGHRPPSAAIRSRTLSGTSEVPMRTPSRASLALAMGFFATSGITAVAATSASAAPSHPSLARPPAVAHHTARVVSLTVPGTGLRLSASVDDEGQVNDVDEMENEPEVNDANDVEAQDEANDANDADDAGDDQGEDNDGQEEAGEDQGEDQNDDQGEDAGGDNSGPGSVNSGHDDPADDSGHGGGDD